MNNNPIETGEHSDPVEGKGLPVSSRTDLSAAHLRALGEVAFWASRIERTMFEVVSVMIDSSGENGHVVASGMSFESLIQLARRLASQPNAAPGLQIDLLAVLPEAKRAMEERNALLHGYWDTFPDGAFPSLEIRRRGSKELRMTVSSEHVVQAALDLELVSDRLFITYLIAAEMVEHYFSDEYR